MYSDACDRSTPAQSLPAGAVALSRARSTNPEVFRRGWKSAGQPDPELPPDMDDSSGVNATVREYFKAEYGKMICYVASQQFKHRMYSVLGLCIIRNWGQCWCLIKWPRPCANTQSWRASVSEGRSLQTELHMFLTLLAVKKESPNLGTCSQALRSMVFTMRVVFPHVEALDHQIVNPASSAMAEISFSSLRWLKTIPFNLWIAAAKHRHMSRTLGCGW